MKLKFLMTLGLLLTALTGCSEGTYAPNTVSPYTNPYGVNGYQTGFNNGFNNFNNGLNNGFNNGFNNFNNGFNNGSFNNGLYQSPCGITYTYYNPYIYNPCRISQAQMQLQAQMMWNMNFRTNSSFYYPMSPGSNCVMMRYPTYTPSNCACVKAPCNCEDIIRRHRRHYTRTRTTTTTVTRTTCHTCGTRSRGGDNTADDNNNRDEDNHDDSNSNTDVKSIRISSGKSDSSMAGEVFKRMALKASSPVDANGKVIDDGLEIKTGKALICTYYKKKANKDDADYTCEFEISAKKRESGDEKGGIILMNSKVSEDAIAEIGNGNPIAADLHGDLIHILKRNGNVAQFLMRGSANEKISGSSPSFKSLFESLSAYGTTTENGVTVASGKEIRCSFDSKAKDEAYACEVRFTAADGAPIAVSDWEKEEYKIAD